MSARIAHPTLICVPTLLLLATACTEPVGVCLNIALPSVSVRVRDAATGAFIASGSTLVVTDGAFTDSTAFPADTPHLNALSLATPESQERPGNYLVTVRRPGYQTWERANVLVTQGACHVRTVNLTANLTAEPVAQD